MVFDGKTAKPESKSKRAMEDDEVDGGFELQRRLPVDDAQHLDQDDELQWKQLQLKRLRGKAWLEVVRVLLLVFCAQIFCPTNYTLSCRMPNRKRMTSSV